MSSPNITAVLAKSHFLTPFSGGFKEGHLRRPWVSFPVQPADAPPRPRVTRRRSWLLPSLVGGYLAVVTLFMVFVLHLSVSPERLILLMLIAALILGRARSFLADWIPFLVLFLSYEYLRGLGGKLGMPIHDVTSLERAFSFGQIPTLMLQHAFYHAGQVSWYDVAGTMFYFLHFAFPLGLGYLFWIVDRHAFLRFSRALIAMSFAAFVFYLLLPVAPPWKAVPGVVRSSITPCRASPTSRACRYRPPSTTG